MDYRKIYVSIVLRAQAEDTARRRNKREQGAYYEKHHIIPKSLGGTNDKSNLAMLTAREHFICHWLLVKMHEPNTDARIKMMHALWRMQSTADGNRYINARAYDALRKEYSKTIGRSMSDIQRGSGNSQYGSVWYTNAYTGETKRFKETVNYPWFKGRNLFRGESNRIRISMPPGTPVGYILKHCTGKNRMNKAPVIDRHIIAIRDARRMWNEFHMGHFTSLSEYAETNGVTMQAVRKRFVHYIPAFERVCQHGRKFCSNIALCNKFDIGPEA